MTALCGIRTRLRTTRSRSTFRTIRQVSLGGQEYNLDYLKIHTGTADLSTLVKRKYTEPKIFSKVFTGSHLSTSTGAVFPRHNVQLSLLWIDKTNSNTRSRSRITILLKKSNLCARFICSSCIKEGNIFISSLMASPILITSVSSIADSRPQPLKSSVLYSRPGSRYYATRRQSASHYYDVLGLTPRASQKEIKSAYYSMSKKYHPDVTKNKNNHTLFTEINEAYEVLGNIQKRRLYDVGLLNERDPRSRHRPNDTGFPGAGARSPFERGERKPPQTGRTKAYNYDEFYRQHYNNLRERHYREWQAYMRYQRQKEQEAASNSEASGRNLWMPIVFMSLIFLYAMITPSPRNTYVRTYKRADVDLVSNTKK